MNVHEIHGRLKAAGKTLADLGEHLGLSHSQVSRLLRGQARMRVETMRRIEDFLRASEGRKPKLAGVEESAAPFITFEEALEEAGHPAAQPVPLTQEEQELIVRELRELGEAAKRLPRLTDLTDDEILGYDDNGLPA